MRQVVMVANLLLVASFRLAEVVVLALTPLLVDLVALAVVVADLALDLALDLAALEQLAKDMVAVLVADLQIDLVVAEVPDKLVQAALFLQMVDKVLLL